VGYKIDRNALIGKRCGNNSLAAAKSGR